MAENKKKEPKDLTMGMIKETPQVQKKRLPDGTFMLLDKQETELDKGKLKSEKTVRDLRAK
ncbi:unnamed protein product [marine sediment metagenome]|uniref:Uncharacterized protein n=1 Tax=marine sediment metagenome TaxID=412755 RepID=X0YFU8_9ZZZZ